MAFVLNVSKYEISRNKITANVHLYLYCFEVITLITVKVRLKPNIEQESLFWWYSKVARNYWNLLVSINKENNKGTYDSLLSNNATYHSDFYNRDVCKLSQMDYIHLAKIEAHSKDLEWFNKPNQSFIYTSIAKELVSIRLRNKGKLSYRSIDKVMPRFPIRCDKSSDGNRLSRIFVDATNKLSIPSIGHVKYSTSHLPVDLNCKKQTAHIVFDGKYWFLEFTTAEELPRKELKTGYTDPVGVDLGIKALATVSDGRTFKNVRELRRFGVLTRRLKRLQRQLSRKYLVNKATKLNKTNNIRKLERKIRLIHRALKNLRLNHIREFVVALTKNRPQYIAIEDLAVRNMLKNKHLAKEISNAAFYTVRLLLTQRCNVLKIPLHIVDRFYPSSKLCSKCGSKKETLKLSERVYKCDACNFVCDRDLNAAINLVNANKFSVI